MRRRDVQGRGNEKIRVEIRPPHRALFRVVPGADAPHRLGGGFAIRGIHHRGGSLDRLYIARLSRHQNARGRHRERKGTKGKQKTTDGALSAPHCAPAPRHPPPRPCGEARARRQDPVGDVRRDEHRRARSRRHVRLSQSQRMACGFDNRRDHVRVQSRRSGDRSQGRRQVQKQGGNTRRRDPHTSRDQDFARTSRSDKFLTNY